MRTKDKERRPKRERRPSPVALLGPSGKRTLVLLGGVAIVKALGLVLVAEGLTGGIVSMIAGDGTWRQALTVGLLGGVLRAAATWAGRYVSQRGSLREKSDLREQLAVRLLRGGEEKTGAMAVLASRGLDDLDSYFVTFLPALVSAVVVPLIVGLRILLADPVSAIIILLTIPLVPVFMILIGMHTRERAERAADALLRLSAHLAELARGLPVLVGLGRVREQAAALDRLSDEHARRTQRTLRTAFLSALAMELIATISVAVVAVFIGVRLVHGGMPLAAGLLVLILAADCYLPLREAGAAYHASEDGATALQRVHAVIDSPLAPALWVGKPQRTDSAAPTVRVRALSLRFPGRPALFRSFGMDAPEGRMTLLDGASGAGKTTLLRVIAGRPVDGELRGLVSGVRGEEIAWSSQHPRFFAATAREELLLHAEGDGVAACAVLAEVGLGRIADAPIETLSPGQERRLAIARALWRVDRGARLLMLDEPTAHLDASGAERVRRAILRRRGATMIIASHDLALQGLCTHRVALDGRAAVSPPATAEAFPPAPGEDRNRMPQPPEQTAHSGSLRKLLHRTRPWGLVGAVLLGVLAVAFAVAQTALSGWLIVRAAEQPPILLLTVAIVGVRFFGLGRAVLRYVERLQLHRAVFTIAGRLRHQLWQALAHAGLRLPGLRRGPAALDLLIGDVDRVRDEIPRVLAPPLVAALSQVALLVVAALLLPSAVVPLLVLAVLTLGVAPLLALRADAQASQREQDERSAVSRVFTGLLESAEDVSVHDVASAPLTLLRAHEAAADRRARRGAAAGGLGQALSVLSVVATALAIVATGSGADGAVLALVALATLSLGESAADAVTAVQRFPALRTVLGRVEGVLDLGAGEERSGARVIEPAADAPELVLKGVAARWPGAAEAVFSGMDLEVRRGEWLTVTGPSGTGKSTLLAAMMGHLPAERGTVRVLGSPVDPDRAGAIAWCPQEGHLFDSSLRANLLLARAHDRKPSDDEMRDALASVGLGPWLDALDEGLDTRIGASGGHLSGGQRQRVAVARTLLTGAPVVLLDEPTAHLDAEGAMSLLEDLRSGLRDRAVVCVTHDLVARDLPDTGTLDLGGGGRQEEAPPEGGTSSARVNYQISWQMISHQLTIR